MTAVPGADLMGMAFKPVKSDIAGNCTKLSGFLEKDASVDTLQKMIKVGCVVGG